MPTLAATLAALERHCGFPKSHSVSVARRLQDAGIIELGVSKNPPRLDEATFIKLLVALMSGRPLREVADVAQRYVKLLPAGTGLPSDAPPHIATAGGALDHLLEWARGNPEDLAELKIEVMKTWPEIAIHHSNGSAQRFVEPGALAGHWQRDRHLTSTQISGRAFTRAVHDLFGKVSA